jgi:hypothetical protein
MLTQTTLISQFIRFYSCGLSIPSELKDFQRIADEGSVKTPECGMIS